MSGGIRSSDAIATNVNTDLAQDVASGTDILSILARLTAARAGYLDNLAAGAIALNADVQTLLTRITAAVALNSDMATVLARLTAARAGYLDNLSAGAVALNSDMATLLARVTGAVALAATALSTAQWTNGRAANLDNLATGQIAQNPNKPGEGVALTSVSTAASQGTPGAWVAIVASLAFAGVFFRGMFYHAAGNFSYKFDLGVGPGGSEVVKNSYWFDDKGGASSPTFGGALDPTIYTAGSRVSMRITNNSTASSEPFIISGEIQERQ